MWSLWDCLLCGGIFVDASEGKIKNISQNIEAGRKCAEHRILALMSQLTNISSFPLLLTQSCELSCPICHSWPRGMWSEKLEEKNAKDLPSASKFVQKKLHPKDLSSTSLRMCGKKAKFCAKVTWRKIFAVCFVLRHSGSHSVIVGQDLPDVLVPQNLEGAVWGSWGWVTLPLHNVHFGYYDGPVVKSWNPKIHFLRGKKYFWGYFSYVVLGRKL